MGRRTAALIALWLGVALAIAFVVAVAHARPGPQWDDVPTKIREWFQSLMQPDNPYMSCCGEADAFEADEFEARTDEDFVTVTVTDGRGIIPTGTKIKVPNTKMKWDSGNPTGHGIVFMGPHNQVYCYVTPGGV